MLVVPVVSSAVGAVRRASGLRALSLMLVSVFLVACGEDIVTPSPVVPRAVASVMIISGESPNTPLTLLRHESRTLLAEARDAQGVPITDLSFAWTSEDHSVAVVAADGRVLAVASGTTAIRVSAGGRTATMQVTVPPSVLEVRVTPAAAVLPVGSSRQYAVVAIDDRGREVTGKPVTWSSSTPAVARVSPTGQVTALMPGYATISATVDGVTGAVALTVEASDWRFEENLFSGRVIVRSDTTNRTEHGYAVSETRVLAATLVLNEQTGAWTLSGELVREERNYLGGNVISRETGRWTGEDRGTTVARDIVSSMRTLRSAITGNVQYRVTIGTRHAWLEGTLPGYTIEMAFQLVR